MNDKVEGTLVLDGLIEGPLGDAEDVEDRLREWVASAGAAGLQFGLEIEGDSFSLLAHNDPVSVQGLGDQPSERIAELVTGLLRNFGRGGRGEVFSTLRSTEYRPHEEVQTIYAIAPDGQVHPHQRTAAARTVAPAPPMGLRDKLRLGAMGLALAALIFGVSAFFVDYRAMFRSLRGQLVPLDPAAVKVETGAFAGYFTIEKKTIAPRGAGIVLTLKRTKDFPAGAEDLQKALAAAKDLPSRLALEDLARGYVRCEWQGPEGEMIGFTDIRIAGLREKETAEVLLPLPADQRPARVNIVY